ncbi:MAG: hypothetical protein II349_04230, partial [Akkermansia sp.]|nr:hypothetical protein [Akkermansia sp.]
SQHKFGRKARRLLARVRARTGFMLPFTLPYSLPFSKFYFPILPPKFQKISLFLLMNEEKAGRMIYSDMGGCYMELTLCSAHGRKKTAVFEWEYRCGKG